MDQLVLKRKPIRSSFTRAYNNLIDTLGKSNVECEMANVLFSNLERLNESLKQLDEQISILILEENDEAKYEKEYETTDEYQEKFITARVKINNYFTAKAKMESANSEIHSLRTKMKLNLPKIELKRFSGEIKEWLGFWSQFKRIHDDVEMDEEDKFQYLIQSTVSGSRAREIVDSFPPTAKNYGKVIDTLKERFGREELLTEYYVRELLVLVVNNTTKNRVNTAQLYDKLESHLRALESIGMTRDKYACMLFPLVESCVPEDILRAWIRSPLHKTKTSDTDATILQVSYSDRLQQLLAFLRSEVEGEERISMARSGFKCIGLDGQMKDKSR